MADDDLIIHGARLSEGITFSQFVQNILCPAQEELNLTRACFFLLLSVSSDYAQPITGQVTEVTCPVIGQA